ncbi:hypothetical protein FZEAL_3592 [Fusarium zealandicum]|uniref:BTB domain-containing protein n=1 Tax=Fusarium zealandicum TaxID=1053134 RepID=A0A8H4UNZ4_9HYPO|nr:hypothetical protein FZEAL_3592 [Fusarium zealandicum]
MAKPAVSPAMLLGLLETGKFSDFTLVCEGKEFRLHKVIVCAQSSVIAAELERGAKGSHSNVLHITTFNVATVECMIEFLYHEEYVINGDALLAVREWKTGGIANGFSTTKANGAANSKTHAQPPSDSLPDSIMRDVLLCHVDVNAIGHHYGLPKLCDRAIIYIDTIFRESWSSAVFSSVAISAFSSSGDKNLHHLISTTAVEHVHELMGAHGFEKLSALSGFGFEILKKTAEKLRGSELQFVKVNTSVNQRSAGDKEKMMALEAELASLKQQVSSLSAERDTHSHNYDAEVNKTTALMGQRDSLKEALEAEKENMTNGRELLTQKANARIKSAATAARTERDDLKKTLEAEKDKTAALVVECDNLKKTVQAEKKKAAASASEHDRYKQAYLAEWEKVATLTTERDNLKRASIAATPNQSTLLSRVVQCHRKVNQTKECRHCGLDFGCWIEYSGTPYDPTYTLRCDECKTRH